MSIQYSETNLFPKGEGLRSLVLYTLTLYGQELALEQLFIFHFCLVNCQGKYSFLPHVPGLEGKVPGEAPLQDKRWQCVITRHYSKGQEVGQDMRPFGRIK